MSSQPVPDVTLQINLSAGDVDYGLATASRLAELHRPDVREVVVVADLCRPPSSRDFHAPSRLPTDEFGTRLLQLRDMCTELSRTRVVDRVVYLEPNPEQLRALNRKFAGVDTALSHDHLGHAFSSYFLGWETARTRYVAHFDADILLWQQPGFSWLRSAIHALENREDLMAASPRIAPPWAGGALLRADQWHRSWSPTWPLEPHELGWTSTWFSTRCHLIDRARLASKLPLAGTRSSTWAPIVSRLASPAYRVGALTRLDRSRIARGIMRRLPAFPLPPEVLLHEHARTHGFRCLYLADERAWFIHPDTKPAAFTRSLSKLVDAITRRGSVPDTQRGASALDYAAWESFAS